MRSALSWFIAVLTRQIQREIPFVREPLSEHVLLYSDADGKGNVAACAIKGDTRIYMKGRIPHRVRHMLRMRQTNIVGYELLVAVAASFFLP